MGSEKESNAEDISSSSDRHNSSGRHYKHYHGKQGRRIKRTLNFSVGLSIQIILTLVTLKFSDGNSNNAPEIILLPIFGGHGNGRTYHILNA